MRRAGATVGAVWVVNVQLPTGYRVHWRRRHPADTARGKRAGLLYAVQRHRGLQGVDVEQQPGRQLLPEGWNSGVELQNERGLDIGHADVAQAAHANAGPNSDVRRLSL
jgi:hypothetical protein